MNVKSRFVESCSFLLSWVEAGFLVAKSSIYLYVSEVKECSGSERMGEEQPTAGKVLYCIKSKSLE